MCLDGRPRAADGRGVRGAKAACNRRFCDVENAENKVTLRAFDLIMFDSICG